MNNEIIDKLNGALNREVTTILRRTVDTWLMRQTAVDQALAAGAREPHNLIEVRYGLPSGPYCYGPHDYVPRQAAGAWLTDLPWSWIEPCHIGKISITTNRRKTPCQ